MQWKQKECKDRFQKNSTITAKLAAINKVKDVQSFIEPPSSALNNPYLLTNIEEACITILRAIQADKKISIFSDVDADGEFSTATMYNYLKPLSDNVSYFYTQRSQGHGIRQGVDMIPEGTQLLIIVDSSSNDAETCEKLLSCGIEEIVIIDHHIVEKENRFATIVNPQLPDDQYPNKDISGSGMCWKVTQVLDDMLGTDYSENFIDLAGFGIVSDVMNMREPENRYIVSAALDNVQNLGLRAIIDNNAYMDLFNLSTKDIGFSITPLLNAVARLDKIELALELLTTDDEDRAAEIAVEMTELNNSRKQMQAAHMKKFMPMVDRDAKIIVIVDDMISKGFSGVVAGDMANLYQKPVAILRREKGKRTLNGSFRSFGNFKLKSFFSSLDFKFTVMEGHEGAGGIGFLEKELDKLLKLANEGLSSHTFDQIVWYDMELDGNELTEELMYEIAEWNRLAGRGIPEAKFLVKNLLPEEKKLMGKDKTSMKAICTNGVNLMKFRTNPHYIDDFPEMVPVEVVGGVNLNSWMDWRKKEHKSIQVVMDDFRTT